MVTSHASASKYKPISATGAVAALTVPSSDITDYLIQCTDASTGIVTSWLWEVIHSVSGVVATSTFQNPLFDVEPFGPDNYTIRLTVNGGGTPATDTVNVILDDIYDDDSYTLINVTSSADTGAGTLVEALNAAAVGSGSYEVRLTVDVAFTQMHDISVPVSLLLTSINGQTIAGGSLAISDCPKVIVRNIRVYNGVSDITSIGTTSNDALSLRDCDEVLIENCCLAFAQDEILAINNADRFIVRNNFVVYSLTATGGEQINPSTAFFADRPTGQPMSSGVVTNNVFICHDNRPLFTNGRYLIAGNRFGHYRSFAVFISDQKGFCEADVLGNHLVYPGSGWDGVDQGRAHLGTAFYSSGNTVSGTPLPSTWTWTPSSPTPSPSQRNYWWHPYRDPTDLNDITNNVGTNNHDAVELMVLADLMDTEITGDTPTNLPTNAAQLRWNSTSHTLLTCDCDVFTWGRTTVDGNELRIAVVAINDHGGTSHAGAPLVASNIDVDVIDSGGVVRWTGHGIPGDNLNDNTHIDDDIMLTSGTLAAGQELTFNYSEAVAFAPLRIRATFRNPSVPDCASTAIAQLL